MVKIPLDAELSVLVVVGGWGKPSSRSIICRGTDFCPVINSPTTSALAADITTWFRILHSVCIGTFDAGTRFGAFLGSHGSDLR